MTRSLSFQVTTTREKPSSIPILIDCRPDGHCRRREIRPRSTCPVSRTLDVLGDRWSLLVVRDLMRTNVASRNFRRHSQR